MSTLRNFLNEKSEDVETSPTSTVAILGVWTILKTFVTGKFT